MKISDLYSRTSGVEEAPIDDKNYNRKNGTWVEAVEEVIDPNELFPLNPSKPKLNGDILVVDNPNGSTTITGKTDTNYIIEILDGADNVIASGQADGEGNFEIVVVDGLDKNEDYFLFIKDYEGNGSDPFKLE